ncbi:MAG: endonuclease/exonuclease/phosphatase family protein [Flagellimonas sp.]
MDYDFTPNGCKRWSKSKFWDKANKISRAISSIGLKESCHPPILVGSTESENKGVIKSLLKAKPLSDNDYDYYRRLYDDPARKV